MLSVSACRISIPSFSASPGPSEEEEALHAAEEIEQLSAEVSLFPPRRTQSYSSSGPSSLSSLSSSRMKPTDRNTSRMLSNEVVGDSKLGSPLRWQRETAELDDPSIDFSCFGPVRLNYVQRTGSPMTFQPRLYSFPPIRHVPAKSRDYATPEQTQDSFPEFSPSGLAYLAGLKFPVEFVVHVEETPPLVADKRTRRHSSMKSPTKCGPIPPCFLTSGNDERPVPHRPVVRRKPVPKLHVEDPVRHSSFMRFSSMDSFPVLRHRDPQRTPASTVAKTVERSDRVKQYSLRHFLSQGAQGKVYLATTGDPVKLSAIKVISKLAVESFRTLLQEQRLLKRIKGNQFVLNLVDSFHDTENFYLVTDYYPGGDLAHLLYKLGVFETDMARFYISELIVAIRFLHDREIVHRDLKPGNILIKSDGHICVVDFGLCKDFGSLSTPGHSTSDQLSLENEPDYMFSHPRTNGFAGTLVYMSPQAVNQDPYSYETDWWSMGVILYELLQGDTPWVGSDISVMVKKIRREPLVFRKDIRIDPNARDFLEKLLQKRVESRLPCQQFDEHNFLSQIEFSDVEKGILTPPYTPSCDSRQLASGALKDLEKIYIGRTYQPEVDPFPEYNYNYAEQLPSVNLEQLAEHAKDSALEDLFSQEYTPLAPRPGLRPAALYSSASDDRDVARELAPLDSFPNLPTDNTFGEKGLLNTCTMVKQKDSSIRRASLPPFKSSFAFCRSLLQPKHSGIPPISVPLLASAAPAFTLSLLVPHTSSLLTTDPAIHPPAPPSSKGIKHLHPCSPCLSPPLPSMLTVSSVIQTNSLFSVNLTDGSTTQTTLPFYTSILADTSSASGSGVKGDSQVPTGPTPPELKAGQDGTIPPSGVGQADTSSIMGTRRRAIWLGTVHTVLGAMRWIRKSFMKCFSAQRPLST